MIISFVASRLTCAFHNLAPSEPPHIAEGSVDNTSSWRRSQAWRRRGRRFTVFGTATDFPSDRSRVAPFMIHPRNERSGLRGNIGALYASQRSHRHFCCPTSGIVKVCDLRCSDTHANPETSKFIKLTKSTTITPAKRPSVCLLTANLSSRTCLAPR